MIICFSQNVSLFKTSHGLCGKQNTSLESSPPQCVRRGTYMPKEARGRYIMILYYGII